MHHCNQLIAVKGFHYDQNSSAKIKCNLNITNNVQLKNWINALTRFVNPGKIIVSGFSNPVSSGNSGFPNQGYILFTGYHKFGYNNPIRILISGILFVIQICQIRLWSIFRISISGECYDIRIFESGLSTFYGKKKRT